MWSPWLKKKHRIFENLFHITDWLPTLYTAAGEYNIIHRFNILKHLNRKISKLFNIISMLFVILLYTYFSNKH